MNSKTSYIASDILDAAWTDAARQRLRRAIEDRGLLIKDAAEAAGMAPSALSALLKPGASEPLASRLGRLARIASVSMDYILTGQASSDAEIMLVKEVDFQFGLGSSFDDGAYVEEVDRALPAAWVRQFTPSAAINLIVTQGVGDSMKGTIEDSDLILIDKSQTVVRKADMIWALGYSQMSMIKRLRGQPDDKILLMSDNPLVSDQLVAAHDVTIVGRVIAIIRKV
jgi:phage repressor protein C with HTH and peptisase S24 domain